MRSAVLALSAVALLAACEPVPPQLPTGMAPVAILSEGVGDADPGTQMPTSAQVTQLFEAVCVDTYPSFASAPKVLAGLPLKRNSANGIYYHKTLDLSIALLDTGEQKACSMIFASTGDPRVKLDGVGRIEGLPADHFGGLILGKVAAPHYLNIQLVGDRS